MINNNNWNSENIPDQSGRIAIVTGANSGIGFITAKELAKKNAKVVLACRNTEKAEKAMKDIYREYPTARLEIMKLDLSSQQSIREFTSQYKSLYKQLDLLINNAGVMIPPYQKTADGFELQFGTNHLGHFALTGLLLDLMQNTSNARVVTVSSIAHKMGQIHFKDLHFEKKYNKSRAYGQSKLANLLFTYELQRKLQKTGSSIIAVAAHPGWTQTNLQRHSGNFKMLNPVFGQLPWQGALPTLRAATDRKVAGGEFYGPAGFMELKGYPVKVRSNKRSYNKDVAARLWNISEELTGIKYSFINKQQASVV